ncbi:MAG: DNA repair and recombination protein RadB, partial [Archaeoglobaceae archaeon]|nr:DNA repair and recombination protein RadB [Archaeoglobaceae archaeon]
MLIPSGSKCIDTLLGGGIETGTITQIYGGSGTGKTTLCLMFARTSAKNYKVAYVDTEGLSGERVKQIFKDTSLFSNVFVQEVYTFRQQASALKDIEKLCRSEKVKLVIVDCFTSLYRSELEDEGRQVKVKRELTAQLTYLLGIARKMDLAVLITNQMFTDIKTGLDLSLIH